MKSTQKRLRRQSLGRNIIAVLIAVNFAGIAVYAILKKGRSSGQIATSDGELSADVSRALRAAGLAALEAGRYDEAVKRFTDAAKSSKGSGDLTQLIQIAVDLRDKSQPSAVTIPNVEAVEPENEHDDEKPAAVLVVEKPVVVPTPTTAPKPVVVTRGPREQKEREAREARERDRQRRLASAAAAKLNREVEASVAAVPAPAPAVVPGTIIVSSTPSGLNVQLDGHVVGETPVRLTAEPGPTNSSCFRARLWCLPAGSSSLQTR
ncbi:MAG: PEGA domain-containing protein [Clostridia bacterium]|nr:PEGA domain-containing protein [Deltaproteobacteria bacterium]